MNQVEFSCECGGVKATLNTLEKKYINRVVCGCKGCQTFPKFMGKDHFLDKNGGTEIIQTSAGQVTIHSGKENIRAIRQTHKGVLRFYAKCCNTPLMNALPTPGMPMIGIIRKTLKAGDEAFGKVRGVVMHQNKSLNSPSLKVMQVMARTAFVMLRWKMKKEELKSPLFIRKPDSDPQLICEVDQWTKEQYKKASSGYTG